MCSFCNYINSEDKILKLFADLNDGRLPTTFYKLGRSVYDDTFLYSLTMNEDKIHSSWGCLAVNYCPICGRKLSED